MNETMTNHYLERFAEVFEGKGKPKKIFYARKDCKEYFVVEFQDFTFDIEMGCSCVEKINTFPCDGIIWGYIEDIEDYDYTEFICNPYNNPIGGFYQTV